MGEISMSDKRKLENPPEEIEEISILRKTIGEKVKGLLDCIIGLRKKNFELKQEIANQKAFYDALKRQKQERDDAIDELQVQVTTLRRETEAKDREIKYLRNALYDFKVRQSQKIGE